MSTARPEELERPRLPVAAELPSWVRVCVVHVGIFAAAWVALAAVDSASRVPFLWPAAALLVGSRLTSPRRLRPWLTGGGFLALLAAHAVSGYPVALVFGFSASSVLAAEVTCRLLGRGPGSGRAALLSEGDVSRLIGAITGGSLVAAAGYATAGAVTGVGNPLLGGVASFGGHAAAMMVLLPLFLPTPQFAPLAGRQERAVQSVILVSTTILVFSLDEAPAVVFAVMPMFAWVAFRGTLREATILLTVVGVIGAVLTAIHVGPIWDATSRYDIAPELSFGLLQLFLLDCGLILLPLSVMATQQRMSAASAAAEREKLERLVAQATGTAVIATAADGRVVTFNPGAEQMLGLAAQDVVGRLPDTFLSSSELSRHATALGAPPTFAAICRASVRVGDTNRLWWFHRPDGEKRSMRMTLTAVPGEDGSSDGYLATAQDVTEREAAQQALLVSLEHERAATERLRELDRVKADLVATVSHELRTPLTSMQGYLELLEDGEAGELTDVQLGLVERVNRNSRRLLLLVEDLLTHSQIESSQLTIEPTQTDVRELVQAARDAVAPLLETRTLTVDVDVPRDPVVIEADPSQLERMLVNLLTNAVKFTPDGGRVEVRLDASATGATLVVADTGLGIPEHEQDQLFRRFFRSSIATEHAIQGTGLGLTIVQAIVAMHEGSIDVDSSAGKGTVFTVRLPRQPQAMRDGAEAPAAVLDPAAGLA